MVAFRLVMRINTKLHENILAGLAGFEPANNGVKVQCLTTWRQPKMFNRATGLSPVGDNSRDAIFFISKFQISFCELESQSFVFEANVLLQIATPDQSIVAVLDHQLILHLLIALYSLLDLYFLCYLH